MVIFPPESVTVKFGRDFVRIKPVHGWQRNVTYTVIFTTALGDRHGNRLKSPFVLAFSTGQHLDTLAITGMVLDAVTLEPVEGALVGAFEDSIPVEPVRIAFSGEKGKFVLTNLARHKYWLYALYGTGAQFDTSRAEKFSPPVEPVIAGDTAQVPILLIPHDTTAPQVWEISPVAPRTLRVKFSRWVDIRPVITEQIKAWYAPRDSATIFVRLAQLPEKREIVLPVCGKWRLCSQEMLEIPRSFPPDTVPPRLVLPGKMPLFPSSGEMPLVFDEPWHGKIIPVLEDSAVVAGVERLSPNAVELRFNPPPPPGDSVVVVFDSLCDDFGNCTTDTVVFHVESEKPGFIEVRINAPACINPVVFVWDGRRALMMHRVGEKWQLRAPGGKYVLFWLCDEDNNGRWTPGEVMPFSYSEKIFVYPDTISVRAGWSTTVNWQLR